MVTSRSVQRNQGSIRHQTEQSLRPPEVAKLRVTSHSHGAFTITGPLQDVRDREGQRREHQRHVAPE